ncbi:MAG: hypothetical protein JJT95_04310 [Pararhodobacter sp.]|nr:hypothetical protein [Pararhodobacter sp.]
MREKEPANPDDPKGLIRESYRIDGITASECRSILTEWALSLPLGKNERAAIAALLQRHGALSPAHPMTALLQEALDAPVTQPVRRGGRAGRLRDS